MTLSIITINYNNEVGLLKTLNNVECQTFKGFDHIIIDVASTDGSVDVIRKYNDSLIHRKWLSEPDNGIYNAMDKGIRMATGEYIQILNSGDCLYDARLLKHSWLNCRI